MGRSGRVASRVCSTLELRMSLPHAPSFSMALTLPPPPSSSTFALISEPPMCSNSTTAPHPSPDMPRQTPPPPAASVKKKSQPWPQDLFQFMRQHVEVLLLPSSHSSNSSTSTGGKEKRDCRGRNEQEGVPLDKNQRRCVATTESGSGIEVELRAQSRPPEDWEQFLDLKTGELFYFHRGSCKRAKTDPRELGRQADESVRALVLKAAHAPSFFFTPKEEDDDDDDSPTRNETAAASTAPALDRIAATCADAQIASSQTDSRCLEEEASESSHAASPSREEEEVESANSQEKCSKRKSHEHQRRKATDVQAVETPLHADHHRDG